MTAFFGAVVGLVGTFFGIKTSSDATAEAHRTQRETAVNGADKIPPTVLSTNPPDKADNVPSDIHLTATFSKGMDPVTINSNTFKLLDQVTGERVPPSPLNGVNYDEDSRMATFKPNATLQNGRRYGATITARVADEAGNALAEDHTWHFRVNTP